CPSPRSCTACRSGRWTACRCSTARTTRRPRTAGRRSTSRCSATAASTTTAKIPNLKDDVWELYHVSEDFSEANDLAKQQPAKLAELQAVFLQEAIRN